MSDRRAPELSTNEAPSGYRRGGAARAPAAAGGKGGVGKQIGMNPINEEH